MVRRVPDGRRNGPRRPSKWAGPPPLLLLATVAAFVVAPMVDHQHQPSAQISDAAQVTTSPRVVEPRVIPHLATPSARGGTAAGGVRPIQLAPVQVGVASMNMFRQLSSASASVDARRLTSRPSLDVVGWQEAESFGSVLHSLPGWETKTFSYGDENSELAVSWRSSRFRLVAAHEQKVALGVSAREGRYPFGNRLVAVVTLADRATGRQLTVIDAHLPQKIENLDDLGHWTDTINAFRARVQLDRIVTMWKHAPGRWVLGTGDFNFDARADARLRPDGGPTRAMKGTAVSSYQELGLGTEPTYPENDRHIDYVWADQAAYDDDLIKFDGQWVIGGFNSDHNALVTELTLS